MATSTGSVRGARRQITASLLILLASVALAVSCSSERRDGPPLIHYGEDVCDHCNMIISEERYASGAVCEGQDGRQEYLFDDLNCLLDHDLPVPCDLYVHDRQTRQWLPAEDATYVFSSRLQTPMASGTAAFREPAAAQELARELEGTVLSLADVRERNQRGELRIDPSATGRGK